MNALAEQLARTQTLTFDCYGTLIDWSGGLNRAFRQVFGTAAEKRHDELFEAYVSIEAEIESGRYRPYREVLDLTLQRLAERLRLAVPPVQVDALSRMLPDWPPFPDTNEALLLLKKRFRLGVLSNIDRDLFAGTARHLAVKFDFLVCAEDVRSYKPSLGHFQRLREQQGSLDGVVHVAQSLYHDGTPANSLDLAFVWINRYKETNATSVRPWGVFTDLRSFAHWACS